jgi:hypothetical protein
MLPFEICISMNRNIASPEIDMMRSEGAGFAHTRGIPILPEIADNTPPQVDKTACIKTCIKANAHLLRINVTSLPEQILLSSYLPGREVLILSRSLYFQT